MSEVERISLAFERGKAWASAGLPFRHAGNPYAEGFWLTAWALDGWRSVSRAEARQRILNERIKNPLARD